MYGNPVQIRRHPLRTIEENREYLEADAGAMRPAMFTNHTYPRRYVPEVPRIPRVPHTPHTTRVHHTPHIIYRGSTETARYLPPITAARRGWIIFSDYNPILLSMAAIGAIIGVIIAIVKYAL
jgi:hypothetical protein